jgi:hypothetical protein
MKRMRVMWLVSLYDGKLKCDEKVCGVNEMKRIIKEMDGSMGMEVVVRKIKVENV